jgi:hypothetical protein
VIEGIEPTEEYKALMEKERRGELSTEEIGAILHRRHVVVSSQEDKDYKDFIKNKELSYGIVKKYENGTTLWFEPVTDELDGFILRKSGSLVESVLSKVRETYIMDKNDPNILAIYEQRK